MNQGHLSQQQCDSMVRPHCSPYEIVVTAPCSRFKGSVGEKTMFSGDIPRVCTGCVFVSIKKFKKYLDGLFIVLPLPRMRRPHHFLWGFEASLWNGQTAWPAVLAGNWCLCKRKTSWLQNLPVTGGPAARITKFLTGTFVQVSALTFSVLICSPAAVWCVFIFNPTPRFPAHFLRQQLSCHNEVLCIDSGWITWF